ncbi:MAG: DUF2326 domain-containing protein [Candidatus Sericytochromatia bacterium]
MFELIRLYSYPEVFDPIKFNRGVNIILGEAVDGGQSRLDKKTNGVGKSLCVECINFCLLKKSSDSRLLKTPEEVLPKSTIIALELKVGSSTLIVQRTKEAPDQPVITKNGESILFDGLDDAIAYLGDIFLKSIEPTLVDPSANTLSFRELMGPLIRDERSEFSNIVKCYANPQIPLNFRPHLFFWGISLGIYDQTIGVTVLLKKTTEYMSKIKKQITDNTSKSLTDVRAELNSMLDEIRHIEAAIESLKSQDAFNSVQSEVIKIESNMDVLKSEQKLLKAEIQRINSLPQFVSVSDQDVEAVYSLFREGLGEQIVNNLEKVMKFKRKIESFQSNLINQRLHKLGEKLKANDDFLRDLDHRLSEKLKLIDHKGVLKNIKSSIAIYNKKREESTRIVALFQEYDSSDRKKLQLKFEKQSLLLQMGDMIASMDAQIQAFNNVIADIHEKIIGNRETTFRISINDSVVSKSPVRFDMRIYDDGSYSVDRIKVFIYDLSLLINQHTNTRHPKFLIHDNLFNVDQDTLVQSLNFLHYLDETNSGFQYIFTLNRDQVSDEAMREEIQLNIDEHTIANFTKQNRFLKKHYQET